LETLQKRFSEALQFQEDRRRIISLLQFQEDRRRIKRAKEYSLSPRIELGADAAVTRSDL
jgi:hypothetical protein